MLAKMMGLCAIIPATMLLTVSFFVLLALRKVESSAFKVFGYVVTALLWVSTIIVLTGGIYTLATGKCPMQKMMMQKRKMMCQEMMGSKMMDKQMMDMKKMPEMKQ